MTVIFYEYVRREETVKSIESVSVTAMTIANGKELTKSVKSEIR